VASDIAVEGAAIGGSSTGAGRGAASPPSRTNTGRGAAVGRVTGRGIEIAAPSAPSTTVIVLRLRVMTPLRSQNGVIVSSRAAAHDWA